MAFATSLLGGFLAVLFTVFMALYLTIDAPRMRDYLVVFWPPDRQQRASRMSVEMGARLGQWAIGQSVLCAIIGGGAWLGLQLIGVPYAALLGLVWALAEFVPGIGPFLSAIPTIVLGFTVSPEIGVAAAVFSLIWSQVENDDHHPREVMGGAIELHPLVILVALLVGSELLGAPGALLAIPVAATLAVVVDEIRLERMRSQLEPTENGTLPSETLAVQATDPPRTAILNRGPTMPCMSVSVTLRTMARESTREKMRDGPRESRGQGNLPNSARLFWIQCTRCSQAEERTFEGRSVAPRFYATSPPRLPRDLSLNHRGS